jgi:cytochrome c biogenesis protein CcdA
MQLIEVGLAFLEGLALIASPCILPVLPLDISITSHYSKIIKVRPYLG